jgi:hypothetical protein
MNVDGHIVVRGKVGQKQQQRMIRRHRLEGMARHQGKMMDGHLAEADRAGAQDVLGLPGKSLPDLLADHLVAASLVQERVERAAAAEKLEAPTIGCRRPGEARVVQRRGA